MGHFPDLSRAFLHSSQLSQLKENAGAAISHTTPAVEGFTPNGVLNRHIDGPPHSDSLAASGKRERTELAPPWSMITSRRRQPNPWPPLLRISQDPNDRRDNTGACGSGSPYSIRWDRHAGPACRPIM